MKKKYMLCKQQNTSRDVEIRKIMGNMAKQGLIQEEEVPEVIDAIEKGWNYG
jgi:hypothetical protein